MNHLLSAHPNIFVRNTVTFAGGWKFDLRLDSEKPFV